MQHKIELFEVEEELSQFIINLNKQQKRASRQQRKLTMSGDFHYKTQQGNKLKSFIDAQR
jgi:hypothetical protein